VVAASLSVVVAAPGPDRLGCLPQVAAYPDELEGRF
jgi:hypothetical protein